MLHVNENTIEAYKQKARAQIKELKARMQFLEAAAEKTGADMRINYEKMRTDWKSRFGEIETKLENLSDSSGDAWEEIRSGIDSAIAELGSAIEKAKNQLSG